MPSITSVAAFVGLASMALATPLVTLNERSSPSEKFSIPQVKTGKTKWKNGAVEMQKAYQKFSKTVPEKVASAAAAAVTGAVTATPEQYDEEYLCPVLIGTSTLNLDFDTGSSDL
jgi:hypothetical protein